MLLNGIKAPSLRAARFFCEAIPAMPPESHINWQSLDTRTERRSTRGATPFYFRRGYGHPPSRIV
jgi:hypothetical protein